MRACIIGIGNLRQMTLMSLYTFLFKKYGISFDVIYFDRYCIDEHCDADNVYRFRCDNCEERDGLLNRLNRKYNNIMYRRYIINILNIIDYDFLVLWGHETAYLLSDFVCRKFAGKYSVNIRDMWNTNIYRITKRVSRAVKKASFNTVSSDAFIPLLPDAKYLFVHSVNRNIVKELSIKETKYIEPIVITFVGAFRNEEYCFRVADIFANDHRFQLRFIGNGSEKMDEYINNRKYRNIICHGAFSPSETSILIKGTHIFNCAYGAEDTAEMTKLPIRFYYAIYMGTPILATSGTWIQKTAEDIGFSIELPAQIPERNNLAESVYKSYKNIDFKKLKERIAVYQAVIDRNYNEFEKIICNSFHIIPK